jgi:hypothetical protein
MTTVVGVSTQVVLLTTYDAAVSMPIRGRPNLTDILLPLPPGELSLGIDATQFERDIVTWANDITSRLQELLQE